MWPHLLLFELLEEPLNSGIPYCFPVKREAQNAETINFFGILVDLTINSAGTTKKLRFARK
ncbi:hypothetical protein [Mycoplana rhizolycopersici]|jgi:hypothetical protein|uniref:Uncharacterized protein n=1 Tax=Mycoplana rhizolycopersici TaxID=2746702 RepID=A0ABX2QD23_9HYPH|nr:hypothetical protein [Rhizobium rhizolycopersici]NVP55560.1 hypothetical protein [Rhizobium rhizolycopersici]